MSQDLRKHYINPCCCCKSSFITAKIPAKHKSCFYWDKYFDFRSDLQTKKNLSKPRNSTCHKACTFTHHHQGEEGTHKTLRSCHGSATEKKKNGITIYFLHPDIPGYHNFIRTPHLQFLTSLQNAKTTAARRKSPIVGNP